MIKRRPFMIVTVFIFLLPVAFCFSASNDAEDTNKDGRPDKWVSIDNEGVTSIKQDLDFDGNPDYHLKFDEAGNKILEEIDFNRDGEMDDFYLYKSGVLVQRQIDSNYDQNIDIWVYIYEGVYIEKYERDTDFDGTIDIVKEFGENEKPKK